VIDSVVVKSIDLYGNTKELKPCGLSVSRVHKPNEKCAAKCVLEIKSKKDQYVINFKCVGVHKRNFVPMVIFIEAQRKDTDEILQTDLFCIRGSRLQKKLEDSKQLSELLIQAKNALAAAERPRITEPNHQIDQRANPPPTPNQESALTQTSGGPMNTDTTPDGSLLEDPNLEVPILGDLLDSLNSDQDFRGCRFDN